MLNIGKHIHRRQKAYDNIDIFYSNFDYVFVYLM